jgi:hypothetical protein
MSGSMLVMLLASHAPCVLIPKPCLKSFAAMGIAPISKYGLTMIQASKIPVSIVKWGPPCPSLY